MAYLHTVGKCLWTRHLPADHPWFSELYCVLTVVTIYSREVSEIAVGILAFWSLSL